MNSMQAVAMPQVIFDDISVCSEEYHGEYFIAAPSCDYDSQNRLIRYDDSALNVTYVYTYDNRGNILNYRYMDYVPKDTAVSETGGDTYTYSYTNNVFKDAVTSINGEAITYDSSYNPLKWTNGRTLTWVQGRRLETVTDGSTVTTYTYDENGIRVAKNVSSGGRSTQYYVADGTYLGEKTTYRGVTFLITYLYGDSGIVGIEVNGTKYFFVKNLQGDVTGIIDSTGAVIANYAYDAYGYCYSITDASGNDITSPAHIANLNPFRYRSYMYDTETGFYYLTTRYYDPDIGRFLNADSYISTGQGLDGFNMFAYCNSNPVNMIDPNGNAPGDLFDTMDEAAIDFANIYAELGYENRLEYASFIYTVDTYELRTYRVPKVKYFINFSLTKGLFLDCKIDGYITISGRVKVTKYSYVTPNVGTRNEVYVPINWFNFKNKVAEIHNHIWLDDGANNYPSKHDVRDCICYIATPSGILKKFDPDVYDESNYDETVVSWDTPIDPVIWIGD